jgi:hypothetical protein
MTAADVGPGDRLLVRTAFGDEVPRRAVTSVVPGEKFRIVWVCSEEEWAQAQTAGREPEADPWPAQYVRVVEVA